MEEEIKKCIEAQAKFCRDNRYPRFAPVDGICYNCGRQIYERISLEQATNLHVTDCPWCNSDFVD